MPPVILLSCLYYEIKQGVPAGDGTCVCFMSAVLFDNLYINVYIQKLHNGKDKAVWTAAVEELCSAEAEEDRNSI